MATVLERMMREEDDRCVTVGTTRFGAVSKLEFWPLLGEERLARQGLGAARSLRG